MFNPLVKYLNFAKIVLALLVDFKIIYFFQ